ncbi:terminase small subunit [Actinoplanes sp. CA-142083]|uniref:terminase small subunit n=1 Tax=Actinoplanes sp. CA-142083 TaxID=3239903 RepID=UPI003D91184F
MSVRSAVEASLAESPPSPRDEATAQLALSYAGLIDEAAPSAVLAKAIDVLEAHIPEENDKARDAWTRITVALAEHTVASDLGPKLLAALDALLLTPRSRAAGEKGGKANGQPSGNPLDELAAARVRLGRPQAVDATAP